MQKSKSSLFLMELIIVIFFFALTSAVCLEVFVKAHFVAKETEELDYAILWADNAAECFYEFGDDYESIENTLRASFDMKGYDFKLDFSSDDSYRYMDYSFYNTEYDSPVYSYTFKQHIQEVAE